MARLDPSSIKLRERSILVSLTTLPFQFYKNLLYHCILYPASSYEKNKVSLVLDHSNTLNLQLYKKIKVPWYSIIQIELKTLKSKLSLPHILKLHPPYYFK